MSKIYSSNKNAFQLDAYGPQQWLPGGGVVFQHAPGRGVCVSQYALGRGMSAPVHAGIHPPDRMTDACENIKYVVAKKI